MPFKKYVEIEWRQIRLKSFKDWGETKIYLNVAANYPTSMPEGMSERLISHLEQKQLPDQSWVISPKDYPDRILFSGYVENLLQVAITVLESDRESLSNIVSQGATKLKDISRAIPASLFPFIGISSLVFSGVAALLQNMDDLLGTFIYQLRRDTIIPIGRPMTGQLRKGDKEMGEVDFVIYIKPEDAEYTVFYHDVEIFPFSSSEIAVYYSGEVSSGKQVYMIWTLDGWKSNSLVKMKKWGRYWMALIRIAENLEVGSQLEIAFSDDQQSWDNKDGNNWVFQHFRWS